MEPFSKIFIVAGEASGDTYGAELMKALRKLLPEVLFQGAGGPKMAKAVSQQLKLKVEVEAKDTNQEKTLANKSKPHVRFADADEAQGVGGAQRLSVHEVLEGASTEATQPFAAMSRVSR